MAARRLHHLIYVTIINCCLFLIVCGIALGTNKWFTVSTNADINVKGGVNASYGLFSGVKIKQAPSESAKQDRFDLKLVCQGLKGCMFSCGVSHEQRKQDLERLMKGVGAYDFIWCSSTKSTSQKDNDQGTLKEVKKISCPVARRLDLSGGTKQYRLLEVTNVVEVIPKTAVSSGTNDFLTDALTDLVVAEPARSDKNSFPMVVDLM